MFGYAGKSTPARPITPGNSKFIFRQLFDEFISELYTLDYEYLDLLRWLRFFKKVAEISHVEITLFTECVILKDFLKIIVLGYNAVILNHLLDVKI